MKSKEYAKIVLLSLILLLACGSAYAAEVVKLYLELSSDKATVWPVDQDRDYLRGRVVLLDANNELGTTFNGVAVNQAQVIISSANFGSAALFSDEASTKLTFAASDWDATGSLTIPLANAWQEFAVSYDNVQFVGADTIVATLKQGTASLSAQANLTVELPLANCYVLRTGGGLPVPSPFDVLPAPRNALGSKRNDGDATKVQIFTAFYRESDDAYYFTTNLPKGAEKVAIQGGEATNVTLTNGYVETSVVKKKVVKVDNFDSKGSLESIYAGEGKKITFSAEPAAPVYTRWVGSKSGDVNEDGQVQVPKKETENSIDGRDFIDGIGDDEFKDDTAYYTGKIASKITIVGLPINEITKNGDHKESGFKDQLQNPGSGKVSPYDAYALLPKPIKKPSSSFRVPGEANVTYIYGAIIGLDDESKNPGPFTNGQYVKFTLYKEGGVPASEIEVIGDYGSDEGDGVIKTKDSYQAFLPFRMKATAVTDDGSIPSVAGLYIRSAELFNDKGVSQGFLGSAIFSTIDEEGEGIDFIAQDTIASIDLTDLSSLDKKTAGTDAEVRITGKGDERSFEMWAVAAVLPTIPAEPCTFGPKGSTKAFSSISIPNVSGNTAEEDVAFFFMPGSYFLFLFKGDDLDTYVVKYYPDEGSEEIALQAADPDDFEPSSISSIFDEVDVVLDKEEEHNTVALTKVIEAKDIFSNAYGKTDATLPDSDITGKLYLPEDPTAETLSASDNLFPGASVKVTATDEIFSIVEIGFDLDEIKTNRDSGVLRLATKQGTTTKEISMRLRTIEQVGLDNIFVPIPGVTETPVEAFLKDQDGDLTAPVVTASNGNSIDIGLSADNGTIRGGSSTIVVTSAAPRKVFGVKPETGKTRMAITAETDNYGTTTLALTFVPDFEEPTVGELTTGNCSVTIEVIDNQDVDVAETDITVYDLAGTDITATLQRTDVDNGSSGTITLTGFVSSVSDDVSPTTDEPAGTSYTAVIVARDAWNNDRSISRPFDVTCEPASCKNVDPSYGVQGETVDVTITAVGANFVQGVTEVLFGCDNATVDNVAVTSSTELVVTVTIKSSAPEPTSASLLSITSIAAANTPPTDNDDDDDGDDGGDNGGGGDNSGTLLCDITITTGSEPPLTCEDAFKIYKEQPEATCLSITPSVVEGGTATTITITGEGTSFNDSTQVSIDCDAITVSSVTADSATQLTVEVVSTAEATTETCTVTVDDLNCGVLSIATDTTACQLTNIIPASSRPGFFLPRYSPAVITGSDGCAFAARPDIEFSSEDIKGTPIFTIGNRVIAIITIYPGIPAGEYDVTVDGNGGVKFQIR
jgi:hypothetical protein